MADESGLAAKPAALSFEQAAAMPGAALTALQGLRDRAGLQPGHHVLINGASGGVGSFAVQLAVAFGARATGVAGTRSLELVRALGAGRVVDHTREDFVKGGEAYDVVFDVVANRSFPVCAGVLKSGGFPEPFPAPGRKEMWTQQERGRRKAMKRTVFVLLGLAALASLPAGRLQAQGASPWLHVRVEEPQKQVRVNLPLAVVEAALKAAPETIASEGRIHLGTRGKGMSVADLRKTWAELKATGDAELVSVEEKDQTVKVARRAGVVEVRVEKPRGTEQVHVEVPLEVVDALLSGEGEALNIQAALKELQKRRGDIVRVNVEKSTVRVWIDEKN